MNKVSVIIPSYNSHKTIRRTIESVLTQDYTPVIADIIVVDSSDDGITRCLLSEYSDRVKLILIEGKTTPGLARNSGAASATGDILVFIDSDVVLSSGWLAKISLEYSRGRKAGSGSVLLHHGQKDKVIAAGQYFLQFSDYLPTGETRKKKVVPACNFYCSREIFYKAGGFPALRAAEDVLFCLRAAGYMDIWFIPEAECYHIFRESWMAYFKNQMMLGKYILVYRKMELKDRFYYHGLWPAVLFPGFLLVKFFKVNARVLQSGRSFLGRHAYSFPAFLAGLLFWGIGFSSGGMSDG